ncbi:hypothetical protein B0H14DRAFT_2630009 [Mycena olivaceomarginata]|nr:hypothetical protein B0H14DRAFT_2630009 [Mycena olivaceomarginata]
MHITPHGIFRRHTIWFYVVQCINDEKTVWQACNCDCSMQRAHGGHPIRCVVDGDCREGVQMGSESHPGSVKNDSQGWRDEPEKDNQRGEPELNKEKYWLHGRFHRRRGVEKLNSGLVANFGELCIGGMQPDSLSVKNSTYKDGCVDDGTQTGLLGMPSKRPTAPLGPQIMVACILASNEKRKDELSSTYLEETRAAEAAGTIILLSGIVTTTPSKLYQPTKLTQLG